MRLVFRDDDTNHEGAIMVLARHPLEVPMVTTLAPPSGARALQQVQ
jgi:hypothetical protein